MNRVNRTIRTIAVVTTASILAPVVRGGGDPPGRLFIAAFGEQFDQDPRGSSKIVIDVGTSRRVAVWLDSIVGSNEIPLNSYQIAVPWIAEPLNGSQGAVHYIDDGAGQGGSAIIDGSRDDFVFSDVGVTPFSMPKRLPTWDQTVASHSWRACQTSNNTLSFQGSDTSASSTSPRRRTPQASID
jgi:hypothetical protein